MARLREGRSNTAQGAAHFLRETLGRVRYVGAKGQLTVRADSGFYTHAIGAVCRRMRVRFSITVRKHAPSRRLIEVIPEEDWSPIPYWMEGAADTPRSRTPFGTRSTAWDSTISPRTASPPILSLSKGAWLVVQAMAHNLARWIAHFGLNQPAAATTKTLSQRFFSLAGRITRKAWCLTLHLPHGRPWETQFSGALARMHSLSLPS